jgi:multiple antibiotic resistance protein
MLPTMDFPIKPLITLLAIINPIGVIPFYIHFTRSFGLKQRRKTIRTAAFSVFVVVATSALMGLKILEYFGITLASFQVGGGLLLLMSAIQMLQAQPAESQASDVDEGASRADSGASIAVVPLTIPLLTGPAAISTVVIYAEQTQNFWQLGILVVYGLIIGLATWVTLSMASRIAHFMGQTGINVMTRLMGLILAAIAVEVMSDGLIKLFPVLGG